jgi:hypothetical protein
MDRARDRAQAGNRCVARALAAEAYTRGEDVHFVSSRFATDRRSPQPLLGLQAQAGNAAVASLIHRRERAGSVHHLRGADAGLLAKVPGAMVQREVTTTIGTSTRKAVDITQIPTAEIRDIIAELEHDPVKTSEKSEQIELAKTYVTKREAALALIDRFASTAPEDSPQFKGIKADDVAEHLEETIEEPHLINQDELAWCGPNTFLMVIARNDPVGYARYVTEMYTTGQAKLGGMDVKPGAAVKAEWTDEQMEAADWIALGSLRDAGNWFWSATDQTIGFATFPGDITSWFAKYGVAKDKIVQKGGWIAQTDAGDLADANTRFADGWNVLLWVHMFTLHQKGEPEQITKFDIQRTHWVVMNGPFTHDATARRWSCPVNTWGERGTRNVDVSEDKISSSVFGFIAVDMKAQVKKPEAGTTSPAERVGGRP